MKKNLILLFDVKGSSTLRVFLDKIYNYFGNLWKLNFDRLQKFIIQV